MVQENEKFDNYIIQPGDIVIALSGATTGKFGIYPGYQKAYQNQRTGTFQVLHKDELLNQFLFYWLYSMRRKIEKDAYGGAQPNISSQKIEELIINVPPVQEQRRIVNKIEELFSELDNGIGSLKIAQQKLNIYRQSVLNKAFSGELQDGKLKPKEIVKIESLCEFITKGTTPSKENLFSNFGEVPFIKVYNLTFGGKLDFSIDPTFVSKETHNGFLARSKVYPGDVLMNIVGPPLGKVSLVPETYPEWNINQAIARFRCKKELHNKFLMYFLLSESTQRIIQRKAKATAGQRNLTLEICRDI